MLTIRKLTKKYGAEEALRSVDMEIRAGEIHGLVGVNGSGKSTLLNILSGNPGIRGTGGYTGEIILKGVKVDIRSPAHAVGLGIGMIHQEFALIPGLTVAENVQMTRERVYRLTERLFGKTFAWIDHRENHKEVRGILQRLGVSIDPGSRVSDLSVNVKQFVEIAREMSKERLNVLLLDEPTAVLNREDARKLMEALRDVARKGTAILYVSHRLEEILALCDRATVLRDGEVAAVFEKRDFSMESISESMVGHRVVKTRRTRKSGDMEPILSLRHFAVEMPGERIHHVNLDIRRGEILGVTSLSGHGKLALGCGVVGIFKTQGEVTLHGRQLNGLNASEIIRKGVYILPEDRRAMGLLPDHPVLDNIVFAAVQSRNRFLRTFPLPSLRLLDRRRAGAYARECVDRFHIKCASIFQKVKELSGGNQQKVCLARALAVEPEILFISEPTRGIDIGAKEVILDILVRINEERGTTIVMASSEWEELKRICDRIVVMVEGTVFNIVAPDCDDRTFALALSGEGRERRP